MKEIFDIINFFNIYYQNFIFSINDDIDIKLNKSIMFLIYTSILLIILRSEYISIPLALIVVIIIIKSLYIREQFSDNTKCRKSTVDNPFMNELFEVDGLEPCQVDDKEIMNNYYNNLNRNINDVFEKRTGQLYYRPKSIPHKYENFLKFIGSTRDEPDNNCKYNGTNCLDYGDLRYH